MITADRPLLLGSGSPRRKEILSGLGIPYRARAAEVDERLEPGEAPEAYLQRVTRDKLAAVVRAPGEGAYAGVLVADTIVVIDGSILGKPRDRAEAERSVGRLVGRTHTVLTRYAIARAVDVEHAAAERTVVSQVTMRAAASDEVARYAATGEGLDKAGAYAVQGIGCFLVEKIEGSYTNVVGLPACEVVLDLRQAGLLGAFP